MIIFTYRLGDVSSNILSFKQGVTKVSNQDEREVKRKKYPLNLRPTILFLDYECEIIDLSTQGAKFIFPVKNTPTPRVGKNYFVTITFESGESFTGKAKVVRMVGDLVALEFIHTLPFIDEDE